MAGISRTGLRHIESLETNPTLYSLLRIAKALDVDLAPMLSGVLSIATRVSASIPREDSKPGKTRLLESDPTG